MNGPKTGEAYTAKSHKESLTLAKQEKEFNICLQAIERTTAELAQFHHNTWYGTEAIRQLYDAWANTISNYGLMAVKHNRVNPFRTLRNIENVFLDFDKIDALNIHLYWVLHSIREKEIAEDDKRYLYSLISPVVQQVGKAQFLLGTIIQRFMELDALTDEELSSKGIERTVWGIYRGHFQALHDRRKVPGTERSVPGSN